MATGLVISLGTSSSSTGASGHEGSKGFDGTLSTYFLGSTGNGQYLAMLHDAAVALDSVRVAAARGDATVSDPQQRESFLGAAKIQVSSDGFVSDITDVFTFPATRAYHSLVWEQFAITGAPAKTASRILGANGTFGALADIEFVVDATAITNGKPCRPELSSYGGNFSSGAQSLTATAPTTSSAIYWKRTNDGSDPGTPTNGDTLYSGALSVTPSATTRITFIAYDASLSTTYSDVVEWIGHNYDFAPIQDVRDQYGNLVEAHGGGLMLGPGCVPLLHNSKYYRVGNSCNSFNNFGTGGTFDGNGANGVWMYSSATPFGPWALVGNILLPTAAGRYPLRPHLAHCAATSKFKVFVHDYSPVGPVNLLSIAETDDDDIETGWAWVATDIDPDGHGFKDHNYYPCSNGKFYLDYKATTDNIYRSELSSNFNTTTGSPTSIVAAAREAPTPFEVTTANGVTLFGLIYSIENYYDSASSFGVQYILSTSPTSGFTTARDLFSTNPIATDYNGQPTCVFNWNGFLVGWFDHWLNTNIADSRDNVFSIADVAERKATWNRTQFDRPDNVLLDNLVLDLPLDALSGNEPDVLGANNATAVGTPGTFGCQTRSRVTSLSNYFSVANSAAIQLGNISCMGEFWFRRTDTDDSGFPTIGCKDNGVLSRAIGWYVANDHKVHTYLTADGHTIVEPTATAAISANVWNHVIWWHDADDNEFGHCLNNGTPLTVSHSTGIFSETNALLIGAGPAGALPFPGNIRGFRMWKRAKPSSDERTAMYNGGLGLRSDQLGSVSFSAPAFSSGTTTNSAENQTTCRTITVTGTPIPAISISGPDADFFNCVDNGDRTATVTWKLAPNFENKLDANADGVYEVTDAAENSEDVATQGSSTTVTNVNEAPTDIALSNSTVPDHTNTTGGFSVGTLSTSDPDAGATFTYTVVGGSDQAKGSITGSTLKLTDGVLNRLVKASYEIQVRSTDQNSLFFEKTFTITVTPIFSVATSGASRIGCTIGIGI